MTPVANALTAYLSETDALAFNRVNGVTNIVGTGVAANDIVLYKKVGTFGGVEIDCAITTVSVSGSISNYDNPGSASTTTGYLNNFQINTVGGAATFKFEFFQAGTYTGVNTGIPVILQNVKITSIDIDSSGTTGYQYTDFTGFQKYSMMSPTNLGVTPLSNPNRVRFIAAKSGARSSVPEDQVLVKYDAIQTVQMTFGNVVAGSTNYFGLVFGGWPGAGIPVEYSNVYNTPPTSTSESLYVTNNAATTIPLSAFGTYADVDNNPFYQIRIAALPATGSLQFLNGSNWVSASAGQVISVSDIELGKLRFTGAADTSFTFSVHDGLDYSAANYTLTLTVATNPQVITFANPGTKAPNNTAFASNAASDSTLPVTLRSETIGICTVNGLNITPIATGTCVITATQSGNASYSAAVPVTQTFPVDSKTPQVITFNKPSDRQFSSTAFGSSATSDSGLTVVLTSFTPTVCTVSGLDIVMKSTGTCQIRATQPGNGSVAPAAPVDQTFLITPGAPAVVTTAATAVGDAVGTLNGTVNTFGLATSSLYFCISTSSSVNGSGALTCASPNSALNNETSTVATAVSANRSSLTNGTTYYYQLVAITTGGTTYGNVVSFTPLAASTVTAVTNQVYRNSSSSVTLAGTVNAGGTSRNISFCFNQNPAVTIPGTSVVHVNGVLTNCTNVTANPSSSSTSSNVNVTADVSNLSSSTSYYYQVRIVDGAGYVYGKILMFSTRSTKAVTVSANPSSTTATLSGTGNSGSSNNRADTKFCYNSTGDISSIGILDQSKTTTICKTASPSTVSNSDTNISLSISGLTPGTLYYYQAYVRRDSSRYSYGEIKTFTTTGVAPTVQTTAATGIAGTKANLNGVVTANATSTANSFCWGTDSSLSGCASVSATPGTSAGNNAGSISAAIDGLTAGTTYYFRAISTSTVGTTNGSILSFIAGSPLAITGTPTSISATGATLNGAIKSNALDTVATFCYGTSNSTAATGALSTCTSVNPTPGNVLGTTTTPTAIQAAVTGLTSGTTYYYQAVATSGSRINYGAVVSFKAAGEPTATTVAASSIAADGATLNGTILSNGDTATGSFCYSTLNSQKEITGVLDSCIGGPTLGTNTSGNNWSLDVTKLKPGTKYYFQVIGENGNGTKYGNILEFTTSAGAPTATTLAPTVFGTTATLNGEIESLGANATVTFCHGTTSNLSGCTSVSATPSSVLAANSAVVPVTFSLTGLTAGTRYYYRVSATNSAGTTNGSIVDFYAGAPTAITAAAGSVTTTTATLNGTVQSNGNDISAIKYCYFTSADAPAVEPNGGMSLCYGSSSTVTPVNASITTLLGTDTSTATAPLNVTGLTDGSTYYFQIVATNSRGTSYGPVLVFYTGIPVVKTLAPASITLTSARLNGSVNPNGDPGTKANMCLSTTDEDSGGALVNCAQFIPVATGLTGSADTSLTTVVVGLSPATTYFYQATAEGANAQPVGQIISFTTPSPIVTFNLNDGSGTTATQASAEKANLTAQSALSGFTRSGYSFGGWNTSSNGSGGTAYADSAEYSFEADITLYAQWTAVSAPTPPAPTPSYVPEPVREKEKPAVVWKNPGAIKFTTPLSTLQLNAQSTRSTEVTTSILDPKSKDNLPATATKIAGTYTYIPIAPTAVVSGSSGTTTVTSATGATSATPTPVLGQGTVLAPGLQKMKVIFTPTDTNTYEKVETVVEILVQAETKVEWKDPAPIKKTTPVTAAILNAVGVAPGLSNNVPGTYKYDIPEGTTLAPGKREVKVIFTPTDPNYLPSEGKVTITVTADINPLATPIVTPANTPAAKPITNTTSSATAKVTTVGTGLTAATVNGTQVNVVPALTFSGKTSVTVSVSDEGETKDVTVPVTVLPLPAVTPVTRITNTGVSNISWKASPNATSYEVSVAGKTVCATESTSCATNGLVGPKTPVQVIAKGNDATIAPEAPAAYKPAAKPVTALVVYFNTNRSNLDAIDKAQIRSIAKVIIEQGFKNIVVNGHTDIMGGVDNQALSASRANTTFAYLKSLVPGLTVKIGAFASTKPAVKGSSAEALASNRRAEIGVF